MQDEENRTKTRLLFLTRGYHLGIQLGHLTTIFYLEILYFLDSFRLETSLDTNSLKMVPFSR